MSSSSYAPLRSLASADVLATRLLPVPAALLACPAVVAQRAVVTLPVAAAMPAAATPAAVPAAVPAARAFAAAAVAAVDGADRKADRKPAMWHIPGPAARAAPV